MRLDYYWLEKLGYSAMKSADQADRKKQTKKKIEKIVGQSREVLFSASTVLPPMFPDTVTIDRTKLTIAHRVFFRVGEIISLKLEDILNVTAHVGPLLGSIQIHSRFFDPHKPYAVNYLWRRDALKIDRIMHGYSIALQEDIDCSLLGAKELTKMLDKLGQGAASTQV